MKIYFNGFWNGFLNHSANNSSSSFFLNLFRKVFGVVELGNFEDSQILCESVFGPQLIKNKKWIYSIFFSGESHTHRNMEGYDVILYGKKSHGNIVNFPYYILHLGYYNKSLENLPMITKVPKNDLLCIISNPNGKFRNKFLDFLDTKFKITYAGKYKKNYHGKIPDDFGSDEYLKFISDYKIVIAMENSSMETYITEKIINPILAGNIPVYWGAECIADYINPERFISVKSEEDFIDVCTKISEILNSDEKFLEIVNKPIFGKIPMNTHTIADDMRLLLNLE